VQCVCVCVLGGNDGIFSRIFGGSIVWSPPGIRRHKGGRILGHEGVGPPSRRSNSSREDVDVVLILTIVDFYSAQKSAHGVSESRSLEMTVMCRSCSEFPLGLRRIGRTVVRDQI
jgi:hypothetical protein